MRRLVRSSIEVGVPFSKCAPPLKFASLFKVQMHFRGRRISLRLSLRARRGSLLGQLSLNNRGKQRQPVGNRRIRARSLTMSINALR
jgi:hypothetical protein